MQPNVVIDTSSWFLRNGTNDFAIVRDVFEGNPYSDDLIDYAALRTVYDVGAHIGGFTRFVKDKSPQAQIVSIEPDNSNASLFLCNTQMLSGVMLIVARVAYLWRTVRLIRHSTNTGGVAFVPGASPLAISDEYSDEQGSDYPVITLEQLGSDDVDLMKIDCEGGEFDILLNAPLLGLKRFHWIVGEYHGVSGDFGAIADRLAPLFELRRKTDTGGEMGTFCFERRANG